MTTRERTIAARAAESRRGNGAHKLHHYAPGKNRFVVGRYTCSCGQSFTGMNAYERHRADANKAP